MLLSGVGILFAKGLLPLVVSSRLWDSILTTVAPCSARYREVEGPITTQENSATFMPSKTFVSISFSLPLNYFLSRQGRQFFCGNPQLHAVYFLVVLPYERRTLLSVQGTLTQRAKGPAVWSARPSARDGGFSTSNPGLAVEYRHRCLWRCSPGNQYLALNGPFPRTAALTLVRVNASIAYPTLSAISCPIVEAL